MPKLTIPQRYAGTTRYSFPAEFLVGLRVEQIAAEVEATQYAEHTVTELVQYARVSRIATATRPVVRPADYPISGDALAKLRAGLISAE